MDTNQTEFYKEREFGEFISTPITFFVQEFKLIFKGLMLFVAPFILLEVIMTYYLKLGFKQDMMTILKMGTNYNYGEMMGSNLLFSLLALLQSAMLFTFLGVYVKLYILSGKGNFGINDIWEGIKKFYFRVFFGNFLALIMIVIGVILLLIPGIYIGVVMWILAPIIIFEDQSVGVSISRSFDVMKGNWWTTFGAFIVMYIMIIIIGAILGLMLGLIIGLGGAGTAFVSFSAIVGGLIQLIISSVLGIMPIVLYTSFTDKTEKPDLMNRITQIKENEGDTNIFEVKEDNENKKTDESEQNRFLNDEENDRFKPKE
jgi:hypothetical protein